MGLMEKTLALITSEIMGQGDDEIVWIVDGKPGMIGRLKFMPNGRARIRLQLAEEILRALVDLKQLDDLRHEYEGFEWWPRHDGWGIVQYFTPGDSLHYEEIVHQADAVAGLFFEAWRECYTKGDIRGS